MPTRLKKLPLVFAILSAALCSLAHAQVHYQPDGGPWTQRADGGPDAVVDGWYLNLGITGLRVKLLEDAPRHLLVKHVFEGSPAAHKVRPGDLIVGAGGQRFATDHKNGYGMDCFGPDGPILEFAEALEASQSEAGKGRLPLTLLREGQVEEVELEVSRRYGNYAETFPRDCRKTEIILAELLDYLVLHQRDDGSWGSPPHDTFAPLALLASGEQKHLAAVKKNVKMHAATTAAQDDSGLINWRYMAAAIVMSEYYLATGEKWVKQELQEVYDFLISSQYVDLAQVNEKVKETHPDALPRGALDSHGGWGHNPGFEGYGPISMLTGQGALAFALMSRSGIEVDRARHDAAYDFLARASGRNGYVWYEDQAAGADDWADMGRTGAAGIANLLSPYQEPRYQERALAHARVIGAHPGSFPDTHGSPVMGMGYAALAAHADAPSFRRLMDANKWWFVLAQCPDGSFYYQPNRDNAGYGADSRISATAVTAFIFSIPRRNLHVTGKPWQR
ncbi:MAG: hypothetical protein HY812_13165 [Planctomycetes bacterium]|nr:hypothetical protein [Planctomycetota bacterium]